MEPMHIADFSRSAILGAAILFCRIGGCLMIAPGVSNAQVPMQVRLLFAVAFTLALAPVLLPGHDMHLKFDDPILLTRVIVTEAVIGVLIGFLGRAFFSALESLASFGSLMLGFSNPFGVELEPGQANGPLTTLVALAALATLFAADLHWEILRGIVKSYEAIPVMAGVDSAFALRQVASVLGGSLLVAVRVSAPFFLYSVVVNFALALLNRVTPQIAIFFIAPPFVAFGGIVVLYLALTGNVEQFTTEFGVWLSRG